MEKEKNGLLHNKHFLISYKLFYLSKNEKRYPIPNLFKSQAVLLMSLDVEIT